MKSEVGSSACKALDVVCEILEAVTPGTSAAVRTTGTVMMVGERMAKGEGDVLFWRRVYALKWPESYRFNTRPYFDTAEY